MTTNGTLSIVFEEIPDDISSVSASQVMVRPEADAIVIKGLSIGDAISVYTVDGILKQKITCHEEETRVPVSGGNIYVVKTPQKTFKLAM